MLFIRFVAELTILAILSLVAILFSGCMAGMGYSAKDRVKTAAEEYNEGIRWGKLEQAGIHIKKDLRKKFWDRYKAVEDDLEIADSEMISLEVDKTDKKHDRATCRVQYSWSLKQVGLVEKTSTEQKWEEEKGEWVLVSETRTKGSPLAIFDEPAKPKATETAAKAPESVTAAAK